MDNPTFPRPAAVARFVPDRRYTALAAGGFVVAALVALFSTDREGRLLAIVAAVLLAGCTLSDLVFSPRLVATTDGVVIRSPFTRAALPWAAVESVAVVSRNRLGLRNQALEIDAGDVLAEFTRRTLGRDLDEACALVQAFRPT